jgi:hypothetical protein
VRAAQRQHARPMAVAGSRVGQERACRESFPSLRITDRGVHQGVWRPSAGCKEASQVGAYEALFGDLKVFSPLGATRQPVLGDHSFAGTYPVEYSRHVEP